MLAKAAASMGAEWRAHKAMKKVAGMTVGVAVFPRMMHDEKQARTHRHKVARHKRRAHSRMPYWIIRTVSGLISLTIKSDGRVASSQVFTPRLSAS